MPDTRGKGINLEKYNRNISINRQILNKDGGCPKYLGWVSSRTYEDYTRVYMNVSIADI